MLNLLSVNHDDVNEIYKYIDVNPLRGAEPVFLGTKITVRHILKDLTDGLTLGQITSHHPEITVDHIKAAILYEKHYPSDNQVLAALVLNLFP